MIEQLLAELRCRYQSREEIPFILDPIVVMDRSSS